MEIGIPKSQISEYIDKDKSVVCREIKRNSDKRNAKYSANLADKKAKERQLKKPKKVMFTAIVETNVLYYLGLDYSPEQMVGRAVLEGREMVSIERIYQYIWADKKKGGHLYKYLRTKGKKYCKRGHLKGRRGLIKDRMDIDLRPKIVEDMIRIGDLEIDLVVGKAHKGALLTINDRATGLLFMDKVESKEASVIEAKTIELLKNWKPMLHTITSDNGKEFAHHKENANSLEIDFFFAKPYHSWESAGRPMPCKRKFERFN